MALSYDPGSRKWNVSYEKTDNKTDYSTDNKTTKRIYVATDWVTVTSGRSTSNYKRVLFSDAPIAEIPGKRWAGTMDIDRDATESSIKEALGVTTRLGLQTFKVLSGSLAETKNKITQQDTSLNNSYRDLNTANATTNNSNQVKNDAYDKTVTLANNTKGGDYVSQRDTIRNIQGLDYQTKKTLEDYYKAFYSTEKLQQWDPKLGTKPPYGEFDSSYYKT